MTRNRVDLSKRLNRCEQLRHNRNDLLPRRRDKEPKRLCAETKRAKKRQEKKNERTQSDVDEGD